MIYPSATPAGSENTRGAADFGAWCEAEVRASKLVTIRQQFQSQEDPVYAAYLQFVAL